MTKKKDMRSVLGSIMGNDTAKANAPEVSTSTISEAVGNTDTIAEEMGVSEELRQALKETKLKGAGIRKGDARYVPSQEVGCKNGETRATFIVSKETLYKLKYISLVGTIKLKTIVNSKLAEYVAEWEAENGAIEIPSKK